VACVAADSEEIADEAIDLIDIEYKVLPPVITMDDALADGAPQLYESMPGNKAELLAVVINRLHVDEGDVEGGLKKAEYTANTWTEITNNQNSLPLEAPAVIAECAKDGSLYFIGSCTSLSLTRYYIALALNIPVGMIRIDADYVGGSFGSKLFIGNVHPFLFAAFMAKKARRPVKLVMTKEQHLTMCTNRMRTKANVKIGMNSDASVTGIKVRQWAEAGTTITSQSNMLTVGAVCLPFLAKTGNFKFDGEVVVTNRQSSGTFRGYGYLE
jgi:xanthine dehydrogenase molybdenum-binding subunit